MDRVNLISARARRYSSNLSTNRVPGFVTAHSGLPILGEILRQKGLQVRCFDERLSPVPLGELSDADLVGISTQTMDAVQAFRLGDALRSRGVPVVVGGVHASLNADQCLDHADFVVRNEGEETLPELVDALSAHKPLAGIAGLSFWDGTTKVHNPPRPFLKDLDRVPLPNWGLLEGWESPWVSPINRLVYFSQVSRGCDFACNFCSVTQAFGQRYRSRTVDHVIEELKSRPRSSHLHLFFVDDSLMCDRDFMKELLARMLREKIRFPLGWHSQMRAEVAEDPELLDLMRRTNCLAVTCGFESINPRTLRAMKKSQTVRTIKKAVRTFHEYGIGVVGFFVFGSDDDDVETIRQTVLFAVDNEIDAAGFMPLTPFPGTPLHRSIDAQGRIFCRDLELYDVEHVVFWPERMTPYELYTEVLGAYREFYRPVRDLRKLGWILRRKGIHAHPLEFLAPLVWPAGKVMHFYKERVANRDYLKALWTLSQDPERWRGREIPPFSDHGLLYQDLLNWRPMRKYWRLARRGAAAAARTALGQ